MADENQPIAHAVADPDGSWRRHRLDDHLDAVATRAAAFASPFGGASWAALAGRWHDLGKYRQGFQRYIRAATGLDAQEAHIEGRAGRVTHSTAGALWAVDRLMVPGRVLAYLIAGHHAGLHDWSGGLEARLAGEDARQELKEALAAIQHPELLDTGDFVPDLRAIPGGKEGFALWVRMLFSCLVDADFLDTECFMDPAKAERRGIATDLTGLLESFDRTMAELAARAPRTAVNSLRADILRQCRAKAAEPPGLFSLTVPTGGGKTLASMAFALEHARRHDKRRILYVIPYTSIIEQTADVFRGIFGDAVIEHHSNAESGPGDETLRSRLACENWDAPIVVTTSVQFFESLFAARTSRCRKLHNLVDSVVVIDEAQLLPVEFLQPVLDVLNLLSRHYGMSVVLSTATQPALASQEYFDPRRNVRGLDKVRELIDDPDTLYRALKRVEVRMPADWHAPETWDVLAERLAGHQSLLAIVNTRRHARELFRLMPPGSLHLSALMCGAHRSQVIADIKARLKAGIPTRVISTQLVEAGVDLDFPVVYRALAGLDSIAQAAGRCNREGRAELGEVIVFVPPSGRLPDMVQRGIDATIGTLHGETRDPLDRALFARYFERLYHACELDRHDICGLLKVDGGTLGVSFRTAAERFKLIQDEESAPVVVLYRGPDGRDATVDDLLRMLRTQGPERWLMRKLQRYSVNLARRETLRLVAQGDLEETIPGLFVQVGDTLYDPSLGLLPEGADPGAILMV